MGRRDGRLWVVATTFPDRARAEAVARQLVTERLAVCVQVGADLLSCYRWRGELRADAEVAVTLKVREEDYAACAGRLAALHPYETPQIVGWPAARVAEAYGRWAWEEEE